MWGLLYAGLVLALVVRVRDPRADWPPAPVHPAPDEPLWLTRLHHVLFAFLLAGAPLERALAGGASAWRGVGVVCFAAGVALSRVAGRTLGDALSPFIEPRLGSSLVTHGLYRHLRHPIYLAEALIALGAPLTLGCRWTLAVTAVALAVLAVRTRREDEALARTFPEFGRYAAQTKRIVPFVY
jgi:protein-S-isoprenylcysteine O-methyltransferase Ste14